MYALDSIDDLVDVYVMYVSLFLVCNKKYFIQNIYVLDDGFSKKKMTLFKKYTTIQHTMRFLLFLKYLNILDGTL